MNDHASSLAERLFDAALQIPQDDERAAFLDQVCRDDSALRDQLDALLSAHFTAEGFLAELKGGDRSLEPAAARPRPEAPSALIGRYKLLEKIGEGGFGEVWMAEQREPVKRRVALKIVKLGMDSRQVVARFEAERQALAMMDHANIARIFDAGSTDTGRPYFVMELVRGMTITDYCDQNRLPTADRLQLFMLVCHAVQHAHQKGIIHRDLKPSNVLVTMHDGVPVPKVIDFGIAKAMQQELTDKTLFTQFAQFIGTPAYISPEQAEPSGLDIDTRSDIYSLGILLYELLVGQTPFDAKEMVKGGIDALRRIIREKEPTTPSNLLKTLPFVDRTTTAERRRTDGVKLIHQLRGDLDWIVMKCLEKDRARRYDTASALATDIQRHLANEPIVARPPGALYRMRKLIRRNRLAFTATTLVVLAIVGGIGAVMWVQHRANQDYRKRLYVSEIGRAENAWQSGRTTQLGSLLDDCPADLRNWEWNFLQKQVDRWDPTVIFSVPHLRDAGLSEDGRLVAVAADNMTQVREFPSGKWLRDIPTTSGPLAVSPRGEQFATFNPEARVIAVWNMRTGERVAEWDPSTSTNALGWSTDGQQLASGGYEGTISIWNAATGQLQRSLSGPGGVLSVAFSPDDKTLAVGTELSDVQLLDVASGQVHRTLPTRGVYYRRLKFSPDGRRLAASNASFGAIHRDNRVWNLEDGGSLDLNNGEASSFSFSPDSRQLFLATTSGLIQQWDLDRRAEIERFSAHVGQAESVQLLPDGRVFSAGHDGMVKIWQARPSHVVQLAGYKDALRTLAFSPDSRLLVSAGITSDVYVWDARAGQLSGIYSKHGTQASAVAFSSNGLVATADDFGIVHVWNPTTRETVWSQSLTPSIHVYWLAFSPDGRSLYVASRAETITVLDASSGERLKTIDGFENILDGLAVSPDGQLLAICNKVKLSVWLADGSRPLWQAPANPDRCAAFSPDGKWIATGDQDGAVSLWEVAAGGTVRRQLLGHRESVSGVSFHPDGSRLVSCSFDGQVKVWDWKADVELLTLPLPGGGAWHVLFSPDGKTIAAAGSDGIVTLWKTE